MHYILCYVTTVYAKEDANSQNSLSDDRANRTPRIYMCSYRSCYSLYSEVALAEISIIHSILSILIGQ